LIGHEILGNSKEGILGMTNKVFLGKSLRCLGYAPRNRKVSEVGFYMLFGRVERSMKAGSV